MNLEDMYHVTTIYVILGYNFHDTIMNKSSLYILKEGPLNFKFNHIYTLKDDTNDIT